MNKLDLILRYFQKKDQLTVESKEYQTNLSRLFEWLTDNDKITNDHTSKLFPDKTCAAYIISKDQGTIAGIEEIGFLLRKYTRLSFKPQITDGQKFKEKDIIATISGKSREILAYERTILNILQRMSGIASETSSLISLISPISQIQIAATRKTPFMSLDKKAVSVGGGLTHRLNLSDGILIKDNHLTLISKAYKTIQDRSKSGQLIEIEITSEKQAHQVLKTFHNHLAILLDNFSPAKAKSLLSDLGNLGNISEIIFEASGGITSDNILEWAQTGVDILSVGSLTHSSKAVNLSLEICPDTSTNFPSR